MAECERRNLPAERTEVGIVADAEGAGLLLHGAVNGIFDLAFAPCPDNDHFQAEAAHRGLRLLDVVLHEARIVRIDK